MKRTLAYSIALFAIVGLLAAFFLAGKGRTSPTGAVVKADSEPIALVAAPGRVEPVSEEIKMSSELRGKLKSVMVEEGDPVRQGQTITILVNDDEYKVAKARFDAAREEDRSKAEADVALARAQIDAGRASGYKDS